jgi:hypothetical protein
MFQEETKTAAKSASGMDPGRATAASRRGRAGPLWHRHDLKGERCQKPRGREKKERRGWVCWRVFQMSRPAGDWGSGRAVTHSRGSAQGWDRLFADRAGPIGRLSGAVAGARHGGAAIGFFFGGDHFSSLAVLWTPGDMALARYAMQVDSWALALPFVVQAASWQGLKNCEKAEVTAPSSAQHLGIAHVRLCVCRRRPRRLVSAWGLGLVTTTADRRPQTARIMALLQTFAGFFVRRAQLTERAAFHG